MVVLLNLLLGRSANVELGMHVYGVLVVMVLVVELSCSVLCCEAMLCCAVLVTCCSVGHGRPILHGLL